MISSDRPRSSLWPPHSPVSPSWQAQLSPTTSTSNPSRGGKAHQPGLLDTGIRSPGAAPLLHAGWDKDQIQPLGQRAHAIPSRANFVSQYRPPTPVPQTGRGGMGSGSRAGFMQDPGDMFV